MASPAAEYCIDNQLTQLTIAELSERGTEALHGRLQYELEQHGLDTNEQVQWAVQAAHELHADQRRTNGPYIDHVLRVGLWVVSADRFNKGDPDMVTSAMLHDTVEDQAEAIIARWGMGVSPGNIQEDAFAALANVRSASGGQLLSTASLDLTRGLTCPEMSRFPRLVKNAMWLRHIVEQVLPYPHRVVLKSADIMDNAVGNHHTVGDERRIKLDRKYFPAYDLLIRTFQNGIRDEVLPPAQRELAIRRLEEGKYNAATRLEAAGVAVGDLTVQQVLSRPPLQRLESPPLSEIS